MKPQGPILLTQFNKLQVSTHLLLIWRTLNPSNLWLRHEEFAVAILLSFFKLKRKSVFWLAAFQKKKKPHWEKETTHLNINYLGIKKWLHTAVLLFVFCTNYSLLYNIRFGGRCNLKLQESFLARRNAEHSVGLPSLSPKEVFQSCSQIFTGHLQFKPFCCSVLAAVPLLCQNQIKSKPEKFIANYFLYSS